ncbi:MAG: DUF4900 domain-containing protein [Gemmatimonadetes bacterium]|nr:DUF4900 domain-containing protein [Gemmatimonadota bacterium]
MTMPRASAAQPRRRVIRPRRGAALVTVMIVAVVAVTIALASSMLVMGTSLTQRASERAALVDDAALTGLEEARNRLNAKLDSLPLTGYQTFEDGATLSGSLVRRWTWASRIGNVDSLGNAGEYGVQAEIISKALDASGVVAIRRALVYQSSFARYAYFTDVGRNASGSILWFANKWTASGPLHSNDSIYIADGTPPQAIFKDIVTTAKGVYNAADGQFDKGAAQIVARIALPGTADLNILRNIASRAGYLFTPSYTTGDSANTTMRIEFVAVDADGDGNTTGPDDGYFRVYQQTNNTLGAGWAAGRPIVPPAGATGPLDSTLYSPNCGVTVTVGALTATPMRFSQVLESAGGTYRLKMILKQDAFDNPNARCFLGGDPRLTATGVFTAADAGGQWLPRTAGSVPPLVAARPDGAYLWPLSTSLNPNFRGAIFVEGRVGVSGTVRGRVTLAARNNVVVLDDLRQATNPGTASGTCKADDDIIGIFAGENVLWADNMLQSPQQRRKNDNSGWLLPREDFSPSPAKPDLQLHAITLALRSVATERPSPPSGLGTAYWVDRGVVRQVGGRIQQRAGQGSTFSGTNVHGYISDISFNRCAMSYPPPYFPTTQKWAVSQYFELDPQGFSISDWFARR